MTGVDGYQKGTTTYNQFEGPVTEGRTCMRFLGTGTGSSTLGVKD